MRISDWSSDVCSSDLHGMRMMGKADTDGDKAISQAEFQTAALARFDAADANKDGQVTSEERKAQRGAWRAKRGAAPAAPTGEYAIWQGHSLVTTGHPPTGIAFAAGPCQLTPTGPSGQVGALWGYQEAGRAWCRGREGRV